MKKYFALIFTVAALAIFYVPKNKAYAFDTTDINNYFQADNVYVDHLGDLIVDWHKINPGALSGIPADTAIIPMINGTSTLPVPFSSSGGGSGGYFINVPPAVTGKSVSNLGGCAPNGSDAYGPASNSPYGNQYSYGTVWDANSGTYVSVAANVTSGTEIYLTYLSAGESGCSPPANSVYYSSVNYLPTVIAIPAQSNIIAPTDGQVTGNFPAWGVHILANTGSAVTGTVEVDYGETTSSFPLVDSSTFGPIPGGGQQTVTIGLTNNLVNELGATTTWYAQSILTIDNATFAGPQIVFYTNINAPTIGGACDNPESVGLSVPLPGTTITNDFPKWTVSTPGLLEGCNYSLIIGYSPSSTQAQSVTASQDHLNLDITPTYNPSTVQIVKGKNLWNYYSATTTQINYTVQLIDTADGYTVGADLGSFYLAYSSTSSPLTAPAGFNPGAQCGGVCQGFGTIGGGSIATPSSTIAATGNACTPPADWTDIGGGISYGFCVTINFLFVPNDTTTGILTGDMNTLESVPPFSWFFETNAQIAAGAGTSISFTTNGGATYNITPPDASSTTPNNGVAFTVLNGIGTATSTFTLLPADLTSNSFLSDGRLVDDWYNLILTVCVIVVILMLYKIAL